MVLEAACAKAAPRLRPARKNPMNNSVDASKLVDRVAALVEAAKKAGADAADAVAVRGRSSSVSVRLGKVEATESAEGDDTGMERDYDFSSRLHFADLDAPAEIGRKAGERAVRRLNARKARTGPVTVIYDPRVARGIAGHLAGAINGASVARKTSFLRD